MTPVTKTRARAIAAALGLCLLATRGALAGEHTWKFNEIFSNADGTIQFVELRETMGGTLETNVGGRMISCGANSYSITSNVVAPTSFKFILIATPGFAALPGAPTPDFVFPAGQVPFFSTSGAADTFHYSVFDVWSVPAGAVPLDGYFSYGRDGEEQPNSPTNYAGQTGSVDLRTPPAPAGVPDGATAGQAPMTVSAYDAVQDSITMSWDVASCTGSGHYHLVYGGRTQLPAAPGGAFGVDGGVCGLSASMPFVWTSVPSPSDGTSLLWWMVVADDGATVEGPWGHGSSGLERSGPGAGGSSAVCAVTSKTVANACGH